MVIAPLYQHCTNLPSTHHSITGLIQFLTSTHLARVSSHQGYQVKDGCLWSPQRTLYKKSIVFKEVLLNDPLKGRAGCSLWETKQLAVALANSTVQLSFVQAHVSLNDDIHSTGTTIYFLKNIFFPIDMFS